MKSNPQWQTDSFLNDIRTLAAIQTKGARVIRHRVSVLNKAGTVCQNVGIKRTYRVEFGINSYYCN